MSPTTPGRFRRGRGPVSTAQLAVLWLLDAATEPTDAVTDLVLIHPPVALPCEPPLGVATLAGSLRQRGLQVRLLDANIEALQTLIHAVDDGAVGTTAQRRALRQRFRALAQLRGPAAFEDRDRHRAAVGTIRSLLRLADATGRVDLADYQDPALNPLRRRDLLVSAEKHDESPFAGCYERIGRDLAALAPRAVGISINYLGQALPAMALAGALRARLGPGVEVIAGGSLVSCWRHRLDNAALRPFVDRLVFGPGVPELLRSFGCPHGGEGGITLPDYSDLPWPLYLAPTRIASLSTTRGCYWSQCRYCPEAAVGERFASIPASQLVEMVVRVWQESGAGLLHLTDSAIPPASLRRLVALEGTGVRWYGFTRFHPALTDETFCRSLRRAGCVLLQLGLESGSNAVLARLNKGIALEGAGQALRALHAAGIATYLYVMFGTPGERREDAEQTLRFVSDHAPVIGFLNRSLLNLPLGAAPDPELTTWPLVPGGDLSLYLGFSHPHGWDRKAARTFMERELVRAPRLAALVRRTPYIFGPNHAAFFV